MRKKIIFVHGYGLGSPLEVGDWPDLLSKELAPHGFDFNILSMPNPILPTVSEWLSFLNKQKISINKNTYFVGHSLGCITIARFLEKISGEKMVRGCIFVAGFCSLPPEIPLLPKFCSLPLDFSEVKKHSQEFVVISSDNDNFVPSYLSKEFAERLGARMITEHNKGHFLQNVKKIPSVLNSILEMDQMNDEAKEMKKLRKVKKF